MPQAKTKSRPATTAKSRTKTTAKSRTKTTAKSRPATKKAAASRKRSRAPSKPKGRSPIERPADLSEDLFKSLEDGARTAIDAVREFLDTVDRTLPAHGEGQSRREEITDSALQMAERLVHTQYEFLRRVVDSAGKSVTGSHTRK